MVKRQSPFWILASLWLLINAVLLAWALLQDSKSFIGTCVILYAALTLLLSLWLTVLFWLDKRAAEAGRRRISEKTLFLFAIFGGWPGGVLAQQLLRHKSQKLSFRVKLLAIIIAHVGLAALLVWQLAASSSTLAG